MKKNNFYGVGFFALAGAVVLSGCNGEVTKEAAQNKIAETQQIQEKNMKGNEVMDKQGQMHKENHSVSIEGIPIGELSPEEEMDILKMREEEKLARDVYVTLGEKWGKNVFLNIQDSEQTHTSEMKLLIDRYELTDPIVDDGVGVFTSTEMKVLYDEFVASGSTSLLDALVVGATIEDLDIKDLQDALARTNNEDVKIIYTNLLEGSQKHLQSFVKNIEKENGTYAPQYISQEDYEVILAMDRVTGGKSESGSSCIEDGGVGCGKHDGSGAGQGNGGMGAGGGKY